MTKSDFPAPARLTEPERFTLEALLKGEATGSQISRMAEAKGLNTRASRFEWADARLRALRGVGLVEHTGQKSPTGEKIHRITDAGRAFLSAPPAPEPAPVAPINLTPARLFCLEKLAEPSGAKTGRMISYAAKDAGLNTRRDGFAEWADGHLRALRKAGLIQPTGNRHAGSLMQMITEEGRKALAAHKAANQES